jgi:hypothetical protein
MVACADVAWKLHSRHAKTSTANDECVHVYHTSSSATALSVREKLDTDGVECVTLSSEAHSVSHRNSYYHHVDYVTLFRVPYRRNVLQYTHCLSTDSLVAHLHRVFTQRVSLTLHKRSSTSLTKYSTVTYLG